MFQLETHQMTADLGSLLLWCNRCGDHVAHDLTVTTDNQVTQMMSGKYRDLNSVTGIQAVCFDGHKQTIL